jgi:outer membrane receptor protein involved in Fe transport
VALEAIYFANHFDDLISLGPFDPETFNAQYENIGETRASGLELVGTALAGSEWRFSGGYTFLDSKVVHSISSSPIFAPGNQLYRRPRHSGSLQASYSRNRFSLALGGVFIGERVDSDFNFPTVNTNEGYALWNASGEVRFARRTAAFVTLDNLANSDYMEPLGYPALGRSVRAGIRARF